jgi:hypothetical protein
MSETSFGLWTVPGCPLEIEYTLSVIEEIRQVVAEGYQRLSRGGIEVGGVLYGTHEGRTVRILAMREIACEHARGPGFQFSETDRDALAAQLAREKQEARLTPYSPVGWFVSHTRSDITLNQSDLEIYNEFFPAPWQVTFVVRPGRVLAMRAGFFVREPDGSIKAGRSYQEFDFPDHPLGAPPMLARERAPVRERAPAARERAALQQQQIEIPSWERPRTPAPPEAQPGAAARIHLPPLGSRHAGGPLAADPRIADLRAPEPQASETAVPQSPPDNRSPEPHDPAADDRAPRDFGQERRSPVPGRERAQVREPGARVPEAAAPTGIPESGARMALVYDRPLFGQHAPAPSASSALSAGEQSNPYAKRKRRMPWSVVAALALLVAAAVLGVRYFASRGPLEPLSLTVSEHDGQLTIQWNHAAQTITAATGGMVEIVDGGDKRAIPLTSKDLTQGSVNYARRTGDVEVRLMVTEPGGQQIQEASRYIGRPPAEVDQNEADAIRLERDALQDEVKRLRQQNGAQAERIQQLERALVILRNRLGIVQNGR